LPVFLLLSRTTKAVKMNYLKKVPLVSPLGTRESDTSGSPVGVVHLDPSRSYVGIGELLQQYIDNSDQRAWDQIKAKIDYTFENLESALGPLEAETGFSGEVKARLARGQRLLIKPNLVNIYCIHPLTHGPDNGSTTCTEWPFVAALMRWFHDKLGISYYQMSLGEAATVMAPAAALYSRLNPEGKPVTVEAAIEGKAGGFYGGWGFYFVRRYLAETHDPTHNDDPMRGYDESVAGIHIPPGLVLDKLMVFDLNRLHDDMSKGRDVEVPDGVNFDSITLHKAVVGGDPRDANDMAAYPGCILVNVPKLKVHNITLLTNVIKNLGIGLYPMQVAEGELYQWKYAVPHHPVPGMKGLIPHQVWVPEMDMETGLPKRDAAGHYIVRKTGGIPATMVDIIKAVTSQDIFMIHVVDAIEAINVDHTGGLPGTKELEGMVFTGLDPVATDLLCARYMFCNVPLDEALKVELTDRAGGHFPQRVPVPTVDGSNIVTRVGYDCPLARDIVPEYAEQRGLGRRQYYVVGRDVCTGRSLVSLHGHLGTASDGVFSDLVTQTLFYDAAKVPWDLQESVFKYFEAMDQLTGSSLKREFLEAFDEDGDGVVSYEEFGKKGQFGPALFLGGVSTSLMGTEEFGYLRGNFSAGATMLKCTNENWNEEGHHISREFARGAVFLLAYRLSQLPFEAQDPFLPSLTWGNGKWPSFQLASYLQIGMRLYGPEFPNKVSLPSLYGFPFRYADLTQNGGRYASPIYNQPDPQTVQDYIKDVQSGEVGPLDFTLYVPPGYASVGGIRVPNVEETSDPARLLTVSFGGGKEIWPDTTRGSPSG